MKATKKRGFTIIELVIVIAVIAILAAVLIPTFANIINKANESNDIQAARNMNTFLAAANVTGDVNSILDVYDLFDESGYSVENYKPLRKDYYYYYDKEYNQILYVDADFNVLFPTEHKGETYSTLGHNWMSLGMTAVKAQEPSGDNYKNDSATKTITATVANGAEYAYVIENYNKAVDGTKLDLTIKGAIDLMGAATLIEKSHGDITIKGEGTNAVVKNITANQAIATTTDASGNEAQYYTATLVSMLEHNLTVENIVFENLNVKSIYSGNVGGLVGSINNKNNAQNTLTLNNVTIKDSTVIGQRTVGAVVGQVVGILKLNGDVTLDNVKVMTVGGRAALFAKFNSDAQLIISNGAKLINNNSTVSIYESKVSEQKFVDGAPATRPEGWDESAWNGKTTIEGQTCYVYSVKSLEKNGTIKYSVYGFRADAVIIQETKVGDWKAYTTMEAYSRITN